MGFNQIIILKNQGFCYGVNRAIDIAVKASKDETLKKPIYLLGNIVHNKHIQTLLEDLGIIVIEGHNRLEMLDLVPNEATLIFSAHGVSDKVKAKAKSKNLHIIDATCPYVEKTFKLVEDTINKGNDVLFIGKKDHPETEAVLELSNHVFLFNKNDIYNPFINTTSLYVAHQTTMSCYDIETYYHDIKNTYPNASLLDMICRATELRQKDLAAIKNLDLEGQSIIIVIGDKNSNNSTKLYELAKRMNQFDSLFIESVNDLNINDLRKYHNAIIASGTSTPHPIIDEIINTLKNIDNIKDNKVISIVSSQDFIK